MIKNKIFWCGDGKTNESVDYGRKEGEEVKKKRIIEGRKKRQLNCRGKESNLR